MSSVAASAASGEFSYLYYDKAGNTVSNTLTDPPNNECVHVPDVSDHLTKYAFRPANATTSTAILYQTLSCSGEPTELTPGTTGPDQLRFKAMRFVP